MNDPGTKTIHLIDAGERLTINIYNAEEEIAVREPETSTIRHLYSAWRLADGIGVTPDARRFRAFDLTMSPEDLKYIIRANVGWPYSIERRTAEFRTHESLDVGPMRNQRLAVVLSECEASGQATYEGITEISGGEEVLYRRVCLPVMGAGRTVSAIYVIHRPLRGECLPVPWKEAFDAAQD